MSELERWKAVAKSLLIATGRNEEPRHDSEVVSLLQQLNGLKYPVESLLEQEVEIFLHGLTSLSSHTPSSAAYVAQLSCSLLSKQIKVIPQQLIDHLFNFFTKWLTTADPPTELLYVLALLKPSHNLPKEFRCQVAALALDSSVASDVRRAALHYISECKIWRTKSKDAWPLETLSTQLIAAARNATNSKLVLSQLRAIRSLVMTVDETSLLPLLPHLLAGLKFYMVTGLPGQLLHVPPLHSLPVPNFTMTKGHTRQSAGIASATHLMRQSPRSTSSSAPNTSDSDLSDSETVTAVITITLSSKLRHASLSCLVSIFSSLSPRNTFSYWQSFLPDGPRLPNSSPSLLSCALRDPNHKCRSGAMAVLSAMVDNSKPFLAAADDCTANACAFTSFSSQLGAILREVHHRLLLSLETEAHPAVLTQTARSLAVLVSNAPYHKLSSGYVSRILSALQPLSHHRDIDVCVACLTCCGALFSISPSLPEVENLLSDWPWVMVWVTGLLQPTSHPAPHPLLTEALQVLTAATKFYFSSIMDYWKELVDLSIGHLTTSQLTHGLKLLEELTRASADWSESVDLWTNLLKGPLTDILQDSTSPSCAQACSVLATLSSSTLKQLETPLQTLVLTLPLGLSRDESVSSAVSSSAVRVLGVYCSFTSVAEDQAFLQDCQLTILQALASSSQQMRVQASWALANLSDAVTSHDIKLSFDSHHQILSAATNALKDKDMVKCNAVRAVGNVLRAIHSLDEEEVHTLCTQLSHCMFTGTMKLRWNSCYACHSIFSSNQLFAIKYPAATDVLLDTLCHIISTCPNFKVCANATLALSSLSSYTLDQTKKVWLAVLQSFEHSMVHHDFPEYKQASNLQVQLCRCICHLLCVQDDFSVLPLYSFSTSSAVTALTHCFNSLLTSEEEMMRATQQKLKTSSLAVQDNQLLSSIHSVLAAALL